MYVYIKTESTLWTVGFYDPSGRWQPESDWGSPQEAAERVHYLNGNREPVETHMSGTRTDEVWKRHLKGNNGY